MRFSAIVLCLLCIATAISRGASPEKTHAKLIGGDPVKIVCFGDSVTGLYYHTGGERTYTDMLGIALERIHPDAEVTMINAGISGHTTANGLVQIEKDVLAHKPDLVTVMFGLNDMVKIANLETFRSNLGDIVNQCRAISAEVVLCTPNSVITTGSRPKPKLEEYCDVIREVAAEYEVPLCDSFAAFEAMREADSLAWRLTLSDEIHPNMAGHKAIAEQLAEVITGKSVSLDDVGPPMGALSKTQQLLASENPVKILAMPPYDDLIDQVIKERIPDAKLEITPWLVDGLTLRKLEKDASRVRKLKPNLVVIAVPRTATADTQEQFIRSYYWIANYSLSFGRKEWDCVVIHPSVTNPGSADAANDDMIRKLTAAHDLNLIDRSPGDQSEAAEILATWLKEKLGEE